MARALDDKTDAMIISLMDDMKALSLQSEDLSQYNSLATSSNVEEMKIVLQIYDDVSEKLSKITEHTAKTAALKETLVGTVLMGSSEMVLTFLPFSDSFDTYVIEEDSQIETEDELAAVDADFERKNPHYHTRLPKVCYKPVKFCLLNS